MKNNALLLDIKLILTCVIIVLNLDLNAQKIEVRSFNETHEVSWFPEQRKDLNNNICALVRVAILPSDHIAFKGNVIGNVGYEGNEYKVYLSKGSRYLRVHYPGYETLLIDFQSYGYDALRSKAVYELVLSLPEAELSDFTQEEYEKLIAKAKAEENKANYIEAIAMYEECSEILQEKRASYYVQKIQQNINYCKIKMALNKLKAEEWEFSNEGLNLYKANGKYGYVDSVGNVIVPPLYEKVWNYRDDVAWVMKDSLWGSISRTGELIVPYQFKDIWNFKPEAYEQNRCIGVSKDMKYIGVVDYKTGEEILPCKYYQPYTFEVDDSEYFCYVDNKERPIFINKKTGKEQFKLAKGLRFRYYMGNGYSKVYKKGKHLYDYKYGLVDKFGNEIFPCEYYEFEKLDKSPWMIIVTPFGSYKDERRTRLYNLKQRVYVGGYYSEILIGQHTESLVIVWYIPNYGDDKTYYGVLNYVTGEEIISPTLKNNIKDIKLPDSNDNPIIVKCYQSEKYYLYDIDGNRYDAPYSEDELNYHCGYTIIKRNGKFGYANSKGELVLDCIFDVGNPFMRHKNILAAAVRIGNDSFYITPSGERIEQNVITSMYEK